MRPVGYVDEVTRFSVLGWAGDLDQPDAPVWLNVNVDGCERGRVTTRIERRDLGATGLAISTAHGFRFDFDPPLSSSHEHCVEVFVEDGDEPLSPGLFNLPIIEEGGQADHPGSRTDDLLADLERSVSLKPGDQQLRLRLGFELLQREKLEEAKTVFLSLSRQDPLNFAALLGLSKVARAKGDRLAALQYARRAAALDKDEPGIALDIAFDLLRLDRLNEAEEHFRALLSRSVNPCAAHVGLGYIARRRGDRSDALSKFREALLFDPDNVEALLEAAGELFDLGEVGAALPLVDQALVLEPRNLNGLMQRGHLARAQLDRNEAAAWFNRAWEGHPDFVPAAVAFSEEQAALGLTTSAADILHRVLRQDPGNLAANLALADLAWSAEDYDRCLELSLRAAQAFPDHPAPPLQATRALMEQGRPDQAIEVISALGEKLGWPPALLSRKGEILARAGRWAEARSVLTPEDCDKDFGLWLQRARLLVTIGNFVEAGDWLTRSPGRTKSEHAFEWQVRAQIAEARWDLKSTRSFYEKALNDNPNAAWAHAELSRVCLLLCDLEACQRHGAEALNLNAAVIKLRGQSLNPASTHVGQICDEFRMDAALSLQLCDLESLEPKDRVGPLLTLLREAPDHTPTAMMLCIALRQSGRFEMGNRSPDLPGTRQTPIPKKIMQYWDEAVPPLEIAAMMAEWHTSHPDFAYVRFDLASAGQYLRDHFPRATVAAYARASLPAQKADLFRLAFLAREGGIYIDADDRQLGSLQDLIGSSTQLLVWQEHFGTLGNNFMAAAPGNPIILKAFMLAVSALNRRDADIPWLSTGPGLLTRTFAQILSKSSKIETVLSGCVVLERHQTAPIALFHQFSPYKRTARHWLRAAFNAVDTETEF